MTGESLISKNGIYKLTLLNDAKLYLTVKRTQEVRWYTKEYYHVNPNGYSCALAEHDLVVRKGVIAE